MNLMRAADLHLTVLEENLFHSKWVFLKMTIKQKKLISIQLENAKKIPFSSSESESELLLLPESDESDESVALKTPISQTFSFGT